MIHSSFIHIQDFGIFYFSAISANLSYISARCQQKYRNSFILIFPIFPLKPNLSGNIGNSIIQIFPTFPLKPISSGNIGKSLISIFLIFPRKFSSSGNIGMSLVSIFPIFPLKPQQYLDLTLGEFPPIHTHTFGKYGEFSAVVLDLGV